MKKRILALVTALILMLSVYIIPAHAIKDTRDGVAAVACCFETKDGEQIGLSSYGTCFFVGEEGKDPTNLITNYHVIDQYYKLGRGQLTSVTLYDVYGFYDYVIDEDLELELKSQKVTGRCKIYVYFDSLSTNDRVEAYPIEVDDVKDIAVLKLNSPTERRRSLPLLVPTQDMVGTNNIQAVGFPSISDNDFMAPVTEWGPNDVTVTTGAISKLAVQQGTGVNKLQVDCEVNHGNSGGPLTNSDGAVLGITSTYVADVDDNNVQSKINYAINISEAMSILDKNNVKYSLFNSNPDPDSDTDSDDNNDGKTVSGNVNDKEAVDSTTADNNNNQKQEKSDNTLMWIIIIAAVVVVLGGGAVLAIVLSGKKKNKQVKSAENNAQAAQAAAQAAQEALKKTPIIRSLSVQHRGTKVELQGANPITIGRSKADCAIVFTNETPGVSGRHCTVAFDPATNDFVVTDLKSSYGTFLQNGQRLTPLVPYRLRSGDRFYVGEPGNLIAVELG